MVWCVAEGYSMMFNGDVTSKGVVVCVVNLLGGHWQCIPRATALIPAETESEHLYSGL